MLATLHTVPSATQCLPHTAPPPQCVASHTHTHTHTHTHPSYYIFALQKDLLSVLCVAVQTCKNFKVRPSLGHGPPQHSAGIVHYVLLQVRSNAALALGSPVHYLGREQFLAVWEAVIQALGNSEEQIGDFSEYKHAATLKTQVTPQSLPY